MYTDLNLFVGLQDAGLGNVMGNKAFLEAFTNVSNLQGVLVGQSTNDKSASHISWVIVNWHLKVLRRPQVCERYTARTWVLGHDRITAHRQYAAFDQQGDMLACADSVWMAIDLKRMFPARLTDDIMAPYGTEPQWDNFPGHSFTKPDQLQVDTVSTAELTVPRYLCDCNGHVHNPAYIDLASEALPDLNLANNLQVCYKKELLPGARVRLDRGTHDGRQNVFLRSPQDGCLHAWIEMW